MALVPKDEEEEEERVITRRESSVALAASSLPKLVEKLAKEPGAKNVFVVHNDNSTHTNTNTNTTTHEAAAPRAPEVTVERAAGWAPKDGTYYGKCFYGGCPDHLKRVLHNSGPTGRGVSYIACDDLDCPDPLIFHTACLDKYLLSPENRKKDVVEVTCRGCGETMKWDATKARAMAIWNFLCDWPWFLFKWNTIFGLLGGIVYKALWFVLVVAAYWPTDRWNNKHLAYQDPVSKNFTLYKAHLNWGNFSHYNFCLPANLGGTWMCKLYNEDCNAFWACSRGSSLLDWHKLFWRLPIVYLEYDHWAIGIWSSGMVLVFGGMVYWIVTRSFRALVYLSRKYRTFQLTRIRNGGAKRGGGKHRR
jgi:hypothetical protein